jgi:hypothetical protein
MPSPKPAVAVVLAAVALAGCGGSEDAGTKTQRTVPADQRGILATIDALQTASRDGDGLRICHEIFTQNLARAIRRSAKRSCPSEVRRNVFRRGETIAVERGIQVKGATATAVIREQNGNVSTLHLVRQAGRWRIDRVIPKKVGQTS